MRGSVVINLLLVLVLAGLIGLHWVIQPDPSLRNYEILPDMVHSLARDAQTAATVLPDGTPLDLRPPAGAIARGYMPFTYGATPEEALRAAAELSSPNALEDPDADARGTEVFNTFCSVCHGAGGHGDGNVTKRGVPPPPSLLLEHATKMSDGQMYHVVTLGQGNMASYASQVGREDRWLAIRHIRTLQQDARKAEEAARKAEAEALAGDSQSQTATPAVSTGAEPGRTAEPAADKEH